jgi:hypothetical protein
MTTVAIAPPIFSGVRGGYRSLCNSETDLLNPISNEDVETLHVLRFEKPTMHDDVT